MCYGAVWIVNQIKDRRVAQAYLGTRPPSADEVPTPAP